MACWPKAGNAFMQLQNVGTNTIAIKTRITIKILIAILFSMPAISLSFSLPSFQPQIVLVPSEN
jgi:hypothetical protein